MAECGLLCVSPVHILSARQEARPYSFMVALVSRRPSCLSGFRRLNGCGDGWRPYGFTLWVAAYTHYYLVAYVGAFTLTGAVAAGAVVAMASWRRTSWSQWLNVALSRQVHFPTRSLAVAGYLRDFTLYEFWRLLLHWFGTGKRHLAVARGEPLGPAIAIHVVLCALFVAGVWRLWRFGTQAGARRHRCAVAGRAGARVLPARSSHEQGVHRAERHNRTAVYTLSDRIRAARRTRPAGGRS